ncbi:MAG: adenine deaminase [Candidatus Nanoarchaeia archaeon]|nr:adenine deaminase [Candidatus Nanoarchaeia archaeon]
MKICGNLVDVLKNEIYPAEITYSKNITSIKRSDKKYRNWILPGLIDSHIHIESTMLTPAGFSKAVLPHGTVATVSDPHEIANVSGIKGIEYMIKNTPTGIKIYYTAPSCVPATSFETSGSMIDSKKIENLMKKKKIIALGEVMNYPAVINREKGIMDKIKSAKKYKKKIDGHAPMVSGNNLKKYVSAGITTEHESVSYKEGLEKIKTGVKLMIRNGSSEKNMPELIKLADKYSDDCFFVSDDRSAEDLIKGHMDSHLREAVKLGLSPLKAVKCCTINPAKHYGIDTGIIQTGKRADFVVVNNLKDFKVIEVYINGKKSAEQGRCLIKTKKEKFPLCIKTNNLSRKDFIIKSYGEKAKVRLIEVIPNQIITKESFGEVRVKNNEVIADRKNKICFIAVVNRYKKSKPSLALVKNFYVNGAVASSISHDSHNIVAVGNNACDIIKAVKKVMKNGGLAFAKGKKVFSVPLEIAGLMTNSDIKTLSKKIKQINFLVKKSGCTLSRPFMQLSFLCLLVIPNLKISDRGLFDSKNFKFTELFHKL